MKTTADLQLRMIIHSYQNNGTFLAYNKKDGAFYPVGNTSYLDKKNYLTSTNEVTVKINQFVNENSFLDKKLLSEFNTLLKRRISQLNSQTRGLLGILAMLFFVFNRQSKVRFQQQQSTLTELKESTEKVLKNNSIPEDEIKSIPEEVPNRPKKPTQRTEEPVRRIENPPIKIILEPPPKVPDQNKPEKPAKPLSPSEDDLKPRRLFSDPYLSPPMTKKPPPYSPFSTTPSKPSLFSPVKNPNTPFNPSNSPSSFIPDAPPPPCAPSPPSAPPLVSLKAAPKAKLVAGEPDPLTFSATDFKKLPLFEILLQMEAIDNYVTQTKIVLGDVQEMVKEHARLKESRKSKFEDLADISVKLKQCRGILNQLQEGAKLGKIVHLSFKTGTSTPKIPFIPNCLAEEVQSESEDLEEIRKLLNPALQFSEAIKQYQQLTEYFEHYSEKIKGQIQNIKWQHNQLEEECYVNFGASPALENALEEINKNLKEADKDEASEKSLAEKNKDSQNWVTLAALEKVLEEKNKDIENWVTQCENRKKFREAKLKGLKTPVFIPQPKQPNPKLEEIYKKFKFLQELKNLPQQVQISLNAKNISGTTIKEVAADFASKFYGKLHAS